MSVDSGSKQASILTQIESRYNKSTANQTYSFPCQAASDDSESSIQDLMALGVYRLADQNEGKQLDEIDQLVELFHVVGKLDRRDIRELFT